MNAIRSISKDEGWLAQHRPTKATDPAEWGRKSFHEKGTGAFHSPQAQSIFRSAVRQAAKRRTSRTTKSQMFGNGAMDLTPRHGQWKESAAKSGKAFEMKNKPRALCRGVGCF
jgi:hypothetical protein